MQNRWTLSRAGILNFWYYDEQEFNIQGGRVLFRGANGAGKSVTMQSLLPLVLDGDTRPSRLDPFGSRDRKIEYYLLGDQGEHAERTGYLWLEFEHGQSGRYLTIGIGLRARRGNTKLDFWGFAITDNRRIGKGFDLYQRDFSAGQELKIPLAWKALRDNIAEGGHFVQERREYAKLVNKLLFRYENVESFGEMLHLLLQLRSPKLSKDFKPTTIYGILKNALPALENDEMHPLAEVLDSIDTISDRQMELERHVGFVTDLDKAYETYNRFQLFQQVKKVVKVADDLLKKECELQDQEAELTGKEQQLEETQHQRQVNAQTLKVEQAEINALEQDEAFSKVQELKGKREQKQTLVSSIDKAKRDLRYWNEQKEKVRGQLQEHHVQLQKGEAKQEELMDALETTAREMEFVYHDVFHRRISREMEQDAFWESWKRGVREHQEALDGALTCAKEYTQIKKQVSDQEGELHEVRETRDRLDRELVTLRDALDEQKDQQQARIFAWKNDLEELQISEDELVSVLHQLAMFPDVSYEGVRATAGDVYERQLNTIRVETVQAQNVWKQLLAAEQDKRSDLKSWQNQLEPEPARSPQRQQTRRKYAIYHVKGVPLYAACEFLPHISDETRAMLESLMQETGLLDAWLGDLGLQWEQEDQEFWVQPQPLELGPTLADYLRPTPPEDRSVSAEQIDAVLRSIEIGDHAGGSERVVLSEQGYFRMGTLTGKVQPKARAEYIGKESRKQTRLATIARLEGELVELVKRAEQQGQVVKALQSRDKLLQEEFRRFPAATELLVARDAVSKGQLRLETAQQEVERKNEQYKRSLEKERVVRERLSELTLAWSSLKNERRLEEAMGQLRTYQGDFHELRSVCNHFVLSQKQLLHGQQQLEQIAEKIETEEEHLREQEETLEEVQAIITAYEKVLMDMKVEEKYQRLLDLRRAVEERLRMRKRLDDAILSLTSKIAVARSVFERLTAERAELVSMQEDVLWEWRSEWNLKLVRQWREIEMVETIEGQVTLCRSLSQVLDKEFDVKRSTESVVSNLFKVFTEVRVHLHSYVLELEEQNGRQLAQFNFDRWKPLSPEQFLEQLHVQLAEQNLLLTEKEKELLEKVLIQSVGVSIRQKIQRAEEWVREMNELMGNRNQSSNLKLKLKWEPKEKGSEMEIETAKLVQLLRTDYEHLTDGNREELYQHFKAKVQQAKAEADNAGNLREIIHEFLDYREWYQFKLLSKKDEQIEFRELTDQKFNVMSGGEKAMAMYIPLFVAVSSRYKGSAPDCPKLISLDEAFAGVDEENVRDLFKLLTEMEFDYMMTSQVLWGCFDTVPNLSIYEIIRPKGTDSVDVIPYLWNGRVRSTNFETIGQQVG